MHRQGAPEGTTSGRPRRPRGVQNLHQCGVNSFPKSEHHPQPFLKQLSSINYNIIRKEAVSPMAPVGTRCTQVTTLGAPLFFFLSFLYAGPRVPLV